MPNVEIEINPIKFITIGTVGPKGKRRFYLQAGDDRQTISLVIEKEQARVLGEALTEMLDELMKRESNQLATDMPDMDRLNMDLHEPIDEAFRVAQMGLGYDEDRDQIVLIAQEVTVNSEEEGEGGEDKDSQASVARFWGSRQLMRALSLHASRVIKQGRPDPAHNGRVLYYWT